jgi:hypothetical protein
MRRFVVLVVLAAAAASSSRCTAVVAAAVEDTTDSRRRYCRIHHADLLLQDTVTGNWHRQGSTECHVVNVNHDDALKAAPVATPSPKGGYFSIQMEASSSTTGHSLDNGIMASVAGHYLEYDASWIQHGVANVKEHVLVIPAAHHPAVNAQKWHRSLQNGNDGTNSDTATMRIVDPNIAGKMIVAVVSTQDDAPVTSLSDIYRYIFGGDFAFATSTPTTSPTLVVPLTNDTNATETLAPENDTNSTDIPFNASLSPSPTTFLNATNSSLSPAPSAVTTTTTLVPSTAETSNNEPVATTAVPTNATTVPEDLPENETLPPTTTDSNATGGPLELVSNTTSTTTTINGTSTTTTTTTTNPNRNRNRRRTQESSDNAADTSFAAQHAACTLGNKVVVPYDPTEPIYRLTIPGLVKDYTFGSFYMATEPLLAALILNGTSTSSSLDQLAEYVVLIAPAGLRPASQQPNFRFVAAGAYNSYKTVVTDDWIDTPQVLQHEIGYVTFGLHTLCVQYRVHCIQWHLSSPFLWRDTHTHFVFLPFCNLFACFVGNVYTPTTGTITILAIPGRAMSFTPIQPASWAKCTVGPCPIATMACIIIMRAGSPIAPWSLMPWPSGVPQRQ